MTFNCFLGFFSLTRTAVEDAVFSLVKRHKNVSPQVSRLVVSVALENLVLEDRADTAREAGNREEKSEREIYRFSKFLDLGAPSLCVTSPPFGGHHMKSNFLI